MRYTTSPAPPRRPDWPDWPLWSGWSEWSVWSDWTTRWASRRPANKFASTWIWRRQADDSSVKRNRDLRANRFCSRDSRLETRARQRRRLATSQVASCKFEFELAHLFPPGPRAKQVQRPSLVINHRPGSFGAPPVAAWARHSGRLGPEVAPESRNQKAEIETRTRVGKTNNNNNVESCSSCVRSDFARQLRPT